tara:strand:- start:1007 stop:1153 length:147 start_codon:yes stop_codon:yes gene_type:complete
MIIIALSAILSLNAPEEVKNSDISIEKVEARRRGKGHRGRKRGGSGLR